jgi:hypothetical protein
MLNHNRSFCKYMLDYNKSFKLLDNLSYLVTILVVLTKIAKKNTSQLKRKATHATSTPAEKQKDYHFTQHKKSSSYK